MCKQVAVTLTEGFTNSFLLNMKQMQMVFIKQMRDIKSSDEMEVCAHRAILASVREWRGPLLSSPWCSPLPSPPGAHHSPWILQSLFTCSSSQFYHRGLYPYSRYGVRFGLPCFGLCTNGITLHVFLWDLLLSLKIMLLRFIRLMCSHWCFQFDPD